MNPTDERAIASIWKLGGLSPRELARRVWLEIYEGDLLTRAAALSYFFLLALFPLLLFLTAMLGYFAEAGTELRASLLNYLGRVAPRTASALIYTTVNEISKDTGTGKLSFGLLAALWFASYGMSAISDTLNGAYGVRESRPWWKLRLTAIALTIALTVFIISALALVLYGGEIGQSLAERVGAGAAFTYVWNILQWVIVIAFMLLAFALIYYFAPDLRPARWYWITPGSVAGVALWLFVSFLFRLYLRYFDRYNVTYGSLGAVIVLMLWLYLTGAAILVGGKINAEIENASANMGAPGAKLHGEKVPDDESLPGRQQQNA
jgi:membrane protein